MIDGRAARRRGCRARRCEGRRPELAELLLVALHAMADIGGLVRAAFDIDENRQIAADADRVEMIEEEEAVAAEEILDVVLGRDHHARRCRPRRAARRGGRCRRGAAKLRASAPREPVPSLASFVHASGRVVFAPTLPGLAGFGKCGPQRGALTQHATPCDECARDKRLSADHRSPPPRDFARRKRDRRPGA